MLAVHPSVRITDGGGANRLFQNAILNKYVDRAIFWHVLMKMKQEARSMISRSLSKEEIDFHLLIALALHDLPKVISWQVY